VRHGFTLEAVSAQAKVDVDPDHRVDTVHLPSHIQLFTEPSDAFFDAFEERFPDQRFDLVFVDGLHEFRQAYRDILHSLRVIDAQGIIVVDDSVPSSGIASLPQRAEAKRLHQQQGSGAWEWMGDVYKAVTAVARFHPEVGVATITDEVDRPQTLMWRTGAAQRELLTEASAARLDALEHETFESQFSNGIPAEFRPMTLDAAIGEFKRDVGLSGDPK
jgi:hypothetical protein